MTLTIGVVLGKSLPDNSQNSNIARTVTTSSDDTNNESATSSHEETINSLEDSETIAESNSSDVELDSSSNFNFLFCDDGIFDVYYKDGTMYKCGTDIEPGEYVIFGYCGNAYYDIYESAEKNSIEYQNGNLLHVSLKDGQYIDLHSGILIPDSQFDYNNLKQYGIFLVGKDLEAGEYKIEKITSEYQSKFAKLSINTGDYSIYFNIHEQPYTTGYVLGDGQEYITLKNGEYIALTNLKMYKQ